MSFGKANAALSAHKKRRSDYDPPDFIQTDLIATANNACKAGVTLCGLRGLAPGPGARIDP